MSRPKAILGLEAFEERLCPAADLVGPSSSITVLGALMAINPHPDVPISQSIVNGQLLARNLLATAKQGTVHASDALAADVRLISQTIDSGRLFSIEKNISAVATAFSMLSAADGATALQNASQAFYDEVTGEASLAFGFLQELELEYSTDFAAQNKVNISAFVTGTLSNESYGTTFDALKAGDAGLIAATNFIRDNLLGQTLGHAATAFSKPLLPTRVNVSSF